VTHPLPPDLGDPPQGRYRIADTVVGGAEVVGGWIVLPDGTQIGAVNVDGETKPAEELDVATGQVTVEGELVTVERQG
jgi:serine/threonine-protein kinase